MQNFIMIGLGFAVFLIAFTWLIGHLFIKWIKNKNFILNNLHRYSFSSNIEKAYLLNFLNYKNTGNHSYLFETDRGEVKSIFKATENGNEKVATLN